MISTLRSRKKNHRPNSCTSWSVKMKAIATKPWALWDFYKKTDTPGRLRFVDGKGQKRFWNSRLLFVGKIQLPTLLFHFKLQCLQIPALFECVNLHSWHTRQLACKKKTPFFFNNFWSWHISMGFHKFPTIFFVPSLQVFCSSGSTVEVNSSGNCRISS